MSEIKKVATRDSYGNALVELGKEHDDLIVLDADLAGATKTGMFKKAFPERHWDIGIAEANMTGIAAGVAACGKVPFISSFAMFAAGRAYEQVRNAIGYPHLNVKIGYVPAADAGSRPRRKRRKAGNGSHSDVPSRTLQHSDGGRAGLRGILRERNGLPPSDGISPGGGASGDPRSRGG